MLLSYIRGNVSFQIKFHQTFLPRILWCGVIEMVPKFPNLCFLFLPSCFKFQTDLGYNRTLSVMFQLKILTSEPNVPCWSTPHCIDQWSPEWFQWKQCESQFLSLNFWDLSISACIATCAAGWSPGKALILPLRALAFLLFFQISGGGVGGAMPSSRQPAGSFKLLGRASFQTLKREE